MPTQQSKYIAHIHGTALGPLAPGGWAALTIAPKGFEIRLSGKGHRTTTNRMQLKALLAVLNDLETSCEIEVHTCSKYLATGVMLWLERWAQGNWEKPKKNVDLWYKVHERVKFHRVSVVYDPRHTVDVKGSMVARVAGKEAAEAAGE